MKIYLELFIKHQPAKSALQKTFLPSKTDIKSLLKILKQAPRAVHPGTAVHIINNEISEILEKHSQRVPLPPKRQAYSLQLYWK